MNIFVVDANVINYFQKERISDSPDEASEAITEIFSQGAIALDPAGHCLNEWEECAAGEYPFALSDWVTDNIALGNIQYFEFCEHNLFRALIALGIPKKDHKWVRLAIGSDGKKIVTEDIDLIEPKSKKANAKTISDIKLSGKGTASKTLKKQFGVNVMCCCHVCKP